MKKYKSYLTIAVIILLIPIIYKTFMTHSEREYKVNNYKVFEIFNKKDKNHYYDFIIKNKKEKYSYTIENNAHKRLKIIKDIKVYNEKDISCIVPIYKNNKQPDIYCLKGKEQVSKYYLKDNNSFKKIVKKVKKYKISIPKSSNTKKEYKNITIYTKNIPDNNKIIVWDYKGIVLIDNNENKYIKFLENDLYDNIMATTTKRYFAIFENTSVNGIENIYCYDLEKNKEKTITLKTLVNKDSYINGVVDDTVYVTDRRAKKQFTINIKKEEIKEVGNEEIGFIKVTSNNKENLSKKEFLKEDQHFSNERLINKEITKSKDLIKENNYYYYYGKDKMYKQMDRGNRVLLFESKDIEEWNIKDGDIIYRKDGGLYLYNDEVGLRLLIEYNELKYNYNNIYYLWK